MTRLSLARLRTLAAARGLDLGDEELELLRPRVDDLLRAAQRLRDRIREWAPDLGTTASP